MTRWWMVVLLCVVVAVPVYAGGQESVPLDHFVWANRRTDAAGWDEAIAEYYEGRLYSAAHTLKEMGDDPAVLLSLTSVYKDLGQEIQAAIVYETLTAGHADARIWADAAWTAWYAGYWNRARTLFERSVQYDDGDLWVHYGLGLALERLGRIQAAQVQLERAVTLDDDIPVVHADLAALYEEQGLWQQALEQYETAVARDRSMTELILPMARLREKLAQHEKAWRDYQRAAGVFSDDPAVQGEVEQFRSQHRDVVERKREERRQEQARIKPLIVEPVDEAEFIPTVAVGLLEKARRVEFSGGGPFEVRDVDGHSILSSGASVRWRLDWTDGTVSLIDEEGRVRLQSTEPLTLHLTVDDRTFILYDVKFGSGYFWSSSGDRQYRGDLEVLPGFPGGMTVINRLNLEAYLFAVVPSEVYASWPMESLKTQAVAARTYVLRSLGRYKDRGFDVLGSVASAAYHGASQEHPRANRAVLATRGQVLTTPDGRPIEAVFTSNAGGYTASSEAMWGGRRSYLVGVPELGVGELRFPLTPFGLEQWLKGIPPAFSGQAPTGGRSNFRWVHRTTGQELEEQVSHWADIGSIRKIVTHARDTGGHVVEVEIVGTRGSTVVTGDLVRRRLGGLRSNLFKIETECGRDGKPRAFWFFGGGFGHGVGLSQMGAAGMAQSGYAFGSILVHYYPGSQLKRLW